jgi:hypothetical protein
VHLVVHADGEPGVVLLARRHELKPLAADQRVGGRGHRLEADVVLPGGRVDLGQRIALLEAHLEAAAAAAQEELRRVTQLDEQVVVGALAERSRQLAEGLGLTRGDPTLVQQRAPAQRQRDLPLATAARRAGER